MNQIFNDLLVDQARVTAELELAAAGATREVAEIADFLAGQSHGAKLSKWSAEELGRTREAVAARSVELLEAAGNSARGFESELLMNNSFGERAELVVILLEVKAKRADAGDEASEERVGALEMAEGSGFGFHCGETIPRELRDAGCGKKSRSLAPTRIVGARDDSARNSCGAVAGWRPVRMTGVEGTLNYFNYYTEIEEYFLKKRGAHLLVSPLDWAILETWQRAGISVSAVQRGIDRAFESYQRSRRGAAGRAMKSLAYCVDAVLDAAEEDKETLAGAGPSVRKAAAGEPFSREELKVYFRKNAGKLKQAADKLSGSAAELAARVSEAGKRLAEMLTLVDAPEEMDLEDLERRLTVLEERLTAALTAGTSEEALLEARRELERQLAPYRRKMTAEQIERLERQYLQKRLFEKYEVPRLSLFYLA